MTLGIAFPSAPAILPNFVIRAKNTETGCMYLCNAVSAYAAKKLLEALTAGNTHIEIQSSELASIVAHVYSTEEAAWSLPDNIATLIGQFVRRRSAPPAPVVAPPATTIAAAPPEPPRAKPAASHNNGDDIADMLAQVVGAGKYDKDKLVNLAKANKIWDDKYLSLDAGRTKMVIANKLRGMVRRGETIDWGTKNV